MKTEILQMSYWEHFKFAKELAQSHPINHPKRLKIEKELNKILQKIKQNAG
jgi:hypothetical protein